MSYLRFTHAEYQTMAHFCREQGLAARSQPAFKRSLVQALADASPALSRRVAGLGGARLNLLYLHFHFATRPAADAPPAADVEGRFTPGELQTLAEACGSVPSPVRFVRPFRRVLVELFEEVAPALARKLDRLSGREWERLYDRARELRRRSARARRTTSHQRRRGGRGEENPLRRCVGSLCKTDRRRQAIVARRRRRRPPADGLSISVGRLASET